LPVFDIECDSLTPTKIHVLSYENEGDIYSLTSYDEMREWLSQQTTLVGHNIVSFDIPVLERLLNIKVKAKLIDTLYLSYYLYPSRQLHGLEWWGEELGVKKPEVEDWENLDLSVYVTRCESDVSINLRLWDKQKSYLALLYETDEPEKLPIVSYLMFKADCAREQERSRWKLDIPYCREALSRLEGEQQPKIDALRAVMPRVVKKQLKQPPAKPYKKDGTLSVEGAKWQKYLREQGLTKDHSMPIYVPVKEEEPNPNSSDQIKDWLFSLGWDPITFKFVKEDDGTERKIPQVKLPNSPDICPSVLELAEEEPAIHELAGLSILKHRIGILKGFLENVDDEGFLRARVQGLTNTLRFKHTTVVNLPGVDKPYGRDVRGCLIAREDYELCGADLNSLEDNTKKHFMYDYDPEYVKEMSVPGFDPHLTIAHRGGAVTQEQIDFFVNNKDRDDLSEEEKAKIKKINAIRKTWKTVNYGSTYGIGAAKLARDLKVEVKEAKRLLDVYWGLNWSVKKFAEDCKVKKVMGQDWVLNPVSKMYYSLRSERDIFSTVNQSAGVWVFDNWIREVLKRRRQLTATFHDEGIWEIKKGNQEKMKQLLLDAIQATNDKLKLNVQIGCDIQFGPNYASIH
jgi:hypothetical protein